MKKILLFLLLALAIFVGIGIVAISLYEKQVIRSFTEAANNHLKTKIDVEIEGLSLFDKFPYVSITMKNIKIYGSLDSQKEKLAEIEKAYFTISLLNLIRKNYKINAIYLKEGFLNLYVDKKGNNNYTFIESGDDIESENKLKFDFNKIIFSNLQLNYINKKTAQSIKIFAYDVKGALSIDKTITKIKLDANCDIEHIIVKGSSFIKNKKMNIDGVLNIDSKSYEIIIPNAAVLLANSKFITKGVINYKKGIYDIDIKGKNTDFKTLISLLPNTISKGLKKYNSKGKASFNVLIKKDNAKYGPYINVSFGCKNVELLELNTNKKLKKLSFNGIFTNGKNRNSSSSELTLSKLKGEFDGNQFEGELSYINFDRPFINTYLKGEFPVSFFMQFSDSNHLKNMYGSVKVDFKLKALQEDLERNNQKSITSSGEIELKNISFDNKDGFYKFKKLHGLFLFNKNDIAISDFSGFVNTTDFNINGYLKGFFTHFLNKKNKLLIIADLKSNNINFDELIESTHNKGDKNQAVDNKYLEDIHFNVSADVKKVKWGRFNLRNVKGDILHDNLVFKSNELIGEIGNGKIELKGKLNSKIKNNITLEVATKLNGIEIDSIFYYFNDFNEDFITHKNIKGKVYADAIARMSFDKFLNLKPKTLIADINFKAINGELNNFEPMQNLSKFIGEEELKNIKFSEISNLIHIQDERIEIPNMTINSSVSTLKIKGWHTFDQKIFYKVKVPLKSLNEDRSRNAENALEKTLKGMTLHLIISGTTDDFKITYDKEAVKKIIVDKVVDKIRDLRNLIKGYDTENEENQIELEEEEFFDFDEDTLK